MITIRKYAAVLLMSVFFVCSVFADEFKVGKNQFLLNGKPFVVKAAELHYPRIPKEYWKNRIEMSKALGMNTVCLYTFWNIHEPKEGEFDFLGNNDIRKFVELCDSLDMKVILRPGPYVCAEWEMGGLPWWLLKDKDIRLRENDPKFLRRVENFEREVARQVGDLTADKGGPIIMIQVENEYGSYGQDKEYIANIREIIRKYFGENVTLFQCDWASNFTLNGLDDLVWTMNFGTGADIDSQFEALKSLRPDSPLMCSEYWSGWFDKWGASHETRPADEMISGIREMLSKDISFSLYMTHGGTNWGHWAGANSPGYSPDVTSYDYDAPISESGQPTPKFWMLRELLSEFADENSVTYPVPELVEPIAIDEFELSEVAPLSQNLPEAVSSDNVLTFEELDMGFGSVLYSTTLPAVPAGSVLTVEEPHDYARVFVDGKFLGTLDRRNGETRLPLGEWPEGSRLEILVEAMGRINFGRAIKDFKGITDRVEIIYPNSNKEELKGWEMYKIPDEPIFYENMKYLTLSSIQVGQEGRLPIGAYRGKFYMEDVSDSFLDLSSWGKGLAYVNGHGLGRFWHIGPQQTLYVPGPWLKKGENEIVLFDILGPSQPKVAGLKNHIVDRLNLDKKNDENRIDTDGFEEIIKGSFVHENGWQEVRFDSPVLTDAICLEILGAYGPGDEAGIAELYLLDAKGERLSREKWRVDADSQDAENGNHTPDKTIDLQESTYWQPAPGSEFPHYLLISLEQNSEIGGLQYLPRAETGAPGAISDYLILAK